MENGRTKAFNVTGPGGKARRGVWGDEQPLTGVVVKWRADKGYGFIKPDNGDPDVFVHQSVIMSNGYRELAEGEEVEYTTMIDQGRPKCRKVGPGASPSPLPALRVPLPPHAESPSSSARGRSQDEGANPSPAGTAAAVAGMLVATASPWGPWEVGLTGWGPSRASLAPCPAAEWVPSCPDSGETRPGPPSRPGPDPGRGPALGASRSPGPGPSAVP